MAEKKVKHDWYQTETDVVVEVLARGLSEDGLDVQLGERYLDVKARLPSGEECRLQLQLAHAVDPTYCKRRVLPSKLELRLKKTEGRHWARLEGETEADGALRYPGSGRDWTRVQLDEDTEGQAEGEAALNELFRKIYVDGSDEVKRAMNKSFQESGGTVLSTNWSEVSGRTVDVKPPDGLEWRKWD